jgi:hypothetical protein
MFNFFLAGGISMLYISLLGLVCLGWAISFARRPKPEAVARVISLSVAVFIASAVGVVDNVRNTLIVVATVEGIPEGQHPYVLMRGLSESLSSAALGGAFLMAIWTLMAVGFRRTSAAET